MVRFITSWIAFLGLVGIGLVPASQGLHFRNFLAFLGAILASSTTITVLLILHSGREARREEAEDQ